jgi:hypothetical protein
LFIFISPKIQKKRNVEGSCWLWWVGCGGLVVVGWLWWVVGWTIFQNKIIEKWLKYTTAF